MVSATWTFICRQSHPGIGPHVKRPWGRGLWSVFEEQQSGRGEAGGDS